MVIKLSLSCMYCATHTILSTNLLNLSPSLSLFLRSFLFRFSTPVAFLFRPWSSLWSQSVPCAVPWLSCSGSLPLERRALSALTSSSRTFSSVLSSRLAEARTVLSRHVLHSEEEGAWHCHSCVYPALPSSQPARSSSLVLSPCASRWPLSLFGQPLRSLWKWASWLCQGYRPGTFLDSWGNYWCSSQGQLWLWDFCRGLLRRPWSMEAFLFPPQWFRSRSDR